MKIINLDEKNFKEEVVSKKGKILVDFFAVWCGPCKMLHPVLEKFAEENDGIRVGRVNVDELTSEAVNYKVNVIPTLILFEDGVEKKRSAGFMDEDELKAFVGL